MSFVLFNIRFIGGRKTNKKQARVRVTHVYVARWSGGGGSGPGYSDEAGSFAGQRDRT